MNVLLTGYGRMGREIESILLDRGHTIASRVDKGGHADHLELSEELLNDVDAVIEFALPDGMEDRVKLYTAAKVPVIIGNTGWLDQLENYKKIVEDGNGTFLYGSNFSIGVHMFWNVISNAASLLNQVSDYDIMSLEFHHNKKKDSPSGTALTTAEKILESCNSKNEIWTDKLDREIKPEELHVASVRGGHIPGTHSVLLDSEADTIEITHRARNRKGFALGAVMAAEWLVGKSGFFTVEDFFSNLLEK